MAKDGTVSGNKTMKALLLRKHGGLEELEVVGDHPVPAAVEGHVTAEPTDALNLKGFSHAVIAYRVTAMRSDA